MKKYFPLMVAGLLGAAPALAKNLDGTVWKMRGKGAQFWNSDSLQFNHDAFSSQDGSKKGFGPSAYSVTENDGKVVWSAVQTNPDGEKLEWTGVAEGARMDGSATKILQNGRTRTSHWKAELLTP